MGEDKMDAVGGADMFDLFDLDNDNDIDFETAYKMISNFDDATSLNDDMLPKLGFGSLERVDTAQFGLNHGEQQELPEIQRQQHQQQQWEQQQSIDGTTREVHSGHLACANGPNFGPQLLSVYESNAIEHFLDNLVSQSSAREWEEHSKSPKSDPSPLEHCSYHPPAVDIPEITLTDSDVPLEIQNNPRMVKKWKHVEIEKIRRNQIKGTFDQLIAMARHPRRHGHGVCKLASDKRIPKYTLLNFIVEDITLILQANEKLERLLRGPNVKKEDVSA